jgi:hypothetical protein
MILHNPVEVHQWFRGMYWLLTRINEYAKQASWLAASFLLNARLKYLLTLKMEAVCSSTT